MSKLHELYQLGQSVWLDTISRSFITSGELQRLIDTGVVGVTTNPSIFQKAIAESDDYTPDLERLVEGGYSVFEVYDALVLEDIQEAADRLRTVYDSTGGRDGYISLEVSPLLAYDSESTLEEAVRLWTLANRPNVMIKIPATPAGLPAISAATAAGINVNVTLIFSLERYAQVMAAYLEGLERRSSSGAPLEHIHSVASFFVSRVDTKVDRLLEAVVQEGGERGQQARRLLGQAAVANARLAYEQFSNVFFNDSSGIYPRLKSQGANLQRPLWASTSTKNPAYSDIKYVHELVAPHTVNTMPRETLDAFLGHGQVEPFTLWEPSQARQVLQGLEDLGISMQQATVELEEEGVRAFADSFRSLLRSITARRTAMQPNWRPLPVGVGSFSNIPEPEATLREMQASRVLPRLWEKDYTLWSSRPEGIANRMGWLFSGGETALDPVNHLVADLQQAGFTNALLLGMGGRSLAARMFARVFGRIQAGLHLDVLDSTDPEEVLSYTECLDPEQTIFIVSSKSGRTEETLAFFKFFYRWAADALGPEAAGSHFIAITDAGSQLEALAQDCGFRAVYLSEPNVSSSYSVLTHFGLIPAGLVGVNLPRLLSSTRRMAALCGPEVSLQENPAARLAAVLAEAAERGQDKLTLVLSPEIRHFGYWLEQLISGSTGKDGKGILPVTGEALGAPALYGPDRLFVHIKLQDDTTDQFALSQIEDSGLPLIRINLRSHYELGGQFLLWELATALLAWRLAVHPFDQPDVELARQITAEALAAYRQSGALPEDPPLLSRHGIQVFGRPDLFASSAAGTPSSALVAFLRQAKPGDYLALQAFTQPSAEIEAAMEELRLRLREETGLAVTVGFGPRCLHTTGQYHKGGAARGLFIQFTSEATRPAPVPDRAGEPASSIDFGVLILVQASGDRKALGAAGRPCIRFHFTTDPVAGIRQLAETL